MLQKLLKLEFPVLRYLGANGNNIKVNLKMTAFLKISVPILCNHVAVDVG